MPKAATKKHNGSVRNTPYSAKAAGANNIFKMNTDLGQHVLKNPGVADAIVNKADLKQSDIVLEVGPGTGNLTVRILEKAKKVIAVEMDPRMAAEVTKRVQGKPEAKRLELMVGDVIKTDLPYFDVNLDIYLAGAAQSALIMYIAPRVAILMFQREFAMRLFARPGDRLYSRLSVNAQMWARIDHIMKVGKNNFRPPPQVESNVVRIVPKNPRPQISYDEWDGLLRICFVRKNKVLRANFLSVPTVMDMLESNYRIFCATNDIALQDGPSTAEGHNTMDTEEEEKQEAEDDEWEGFMDVDDELEMPDFFKEEADQKTRESNGRSKRKKRGQVAELVREKVRKALEDTQLSDKRARLCDEGDFLKLLYAFNSAGIHFS